LGQGNGYAAAKASGIPASKIYQALASLHEKGFARKDGMEKPVYLPEPPETLLRQLQAGFKGDMETLRTGLHSLAAPRASLKAMMYRNDRALDTLLRSWLSSARRKVLLSAWSETILKYQALLNRLPKSVKKHVLSYGPVSLRNADVRFHRRPEVVKAELSDRWLIAVIDNERVAVAFFPARGSAHGLSLQSADMAKIFTEYLVHDISINFVMDILPARFSDRIEKKLAALRRNLYSGMN
jgi:sugar-specific transcriptional regulator TrmB